MNSKLAYGIYKLTRINEYYANNLCLTMLGTILNPKLGPMDMLALFTANILVTMFAFAINDIEDAEDDAKDPAKVKRNPISAKILSKPLAYLFTFIIGALSIVLLLPYGSYSVILGIASLVIGFLYSYKPVRLKSMPILDLVSHGLFLGTLELLVVLTAHNVIPGPISLLLVASIFALSVSGDLYNEIRDYEVDRETNIKNTAAYIDEKYVKAVGKMLHWFNVPPTIIIGLVTFSLFENKTRLVLMVLSLLFGVLYLYLEKKYKGQIVRKHAQEIITIVALVLFLSHFFAR
jgi:4-hydroxybenzoate polyprenyltransferase